MLFKGTLSAIALAIMLGSCSSLETNPSTPDSTHLFAPQLAEEVRSETLRCWNDYKKYAWGSDVLRPLSRTGHNWYKESMGISPIDAYSTMVLMGFDAEAREIEKYALSLDWDRDLHVQVFEMNIRVLGGLLCMYSHNKDQAFLNKAQDFGDRLLRAFETPTGIPGHSVNLRSGEIAGDQGKGTGEIVNVAQGASYLLEFGLLSYYTKNPKYYQAAKRATKAIFDRRSDIGLVGEHINVNTGKWTGRWSHLQACVDSYYEYLYKSSALFGDPEIESMWEYSLGKINEHLVEEYQGDIYYTIVDMDSAEITKRSISLYDAFFPAVLATAGDLGAAESAFSTWDKTWSKFGLLPTRYSYDIAKVEYANQELNPELIESACFLLRITKKEKYLGYAKKYWASLKKNCKHEVGYHSIEDVRTMKAKDHMSTFFFAETLKYFYLAFSDPTKFNILDHAFTTEAHNFPKSDIDQRLAKARLGF